jgi:hypothetical protein
MGEAEVGSGEKSGARAADEGAGNRKGTGGLETTGSIEAGGDIQTTRGVETKRSFDAKAEVGGGDAAAT